MKNLLWSAAFTVLHPRETAMVNPDDKAQNLPRYCVYDGPALPVPPGQRIRPKKFARFDDPVIPRSYWYLTAGIAATTLTLGLLLGRFLFR
jgi:hypothetical protein